MNPSIDHDYSTASAARQDFIFPGRAEMQYLPTSAHEINCVLSFAHTSPSGIEETLWLGQLAEDANDLPFVLVRLGKKMSDNYNSNIGFRIFLSHDDHQGPVTGQIERDYHVLSFTFNPASSLKYGIAIMQDRAELGSRLGSAISTEIYGMDFQLSSTSKLFTLSRRGEELRSSNTMLVNLSRKLNLLSKAKQVKSFFNKDAILRFHLENAVRRGCKGVLVRSIRD
ncbi:hypothetical protein MMC21_004671 [Puttea exsequens]|nr:hypothetical protein [Puttea exsequens]